MPDPVADPRQFPDATDLAAAIAEKARHPREVVRRHLDRIRRFDDVINAAVEVLDEEALERADAQAAAGGPLAGVPISLKETYGLAGRTVTAGSVRAPTYTPDTDAVVAQRLKAAGAVVVARGNVPEFAMTHETVNLRFGTTRNPLSPDRIPGGSSGGDAALVASGGAALGMGSDLGGSIRYPAHCCGLVGFKPASGRVDPTGTWPPRDPDAPELFADTMMSLGPITRSVRDARRVYDVISDAPVPVSDVNTPRLLVPTVFEQKIREDAVLHAVTGARDVLRETGAHAVEVELPRAGRLYDDFLKVIIRDYNRFFWEGLRARDGSGLSVPRELWRQMRGRPTVHWHFLRLFLGMQIIRPSHGEAQLAQTRLLRDRRRVRQMLGDDGILVLPTNGALAMKHNKAARYMARPGVRKLFTPTIFANALNLPSISVPAWRYRDRTTGLVPGVQLLCAPDAEDLLFRTAQSIERALQRPLHASHSSSEDRRVVR